ncbi:uncharacterized protein MKZ38_004811 [Zalerion maritima]|uniref:Uncharacterized protein n=1 Tax=Zalerion maritima TaxID=339359 RepID=A0AAD5WPC2_9PEZI|nr:uncharacterized protein MKZ38_004811 [Zalerion maritima]
MQLVKFLVAATTFFGMVSAQEDKAIKDKYEIGEMVFSGPAFPGGKDIELKGTVEQIVAELEKINPNYLDDFPKKEPEGPSEGKRLVIPGGPEETAVAQPKSVVKRDVETLRCDWWKYKAVLGDIMKALDKLEHLDGKCYVNYNSCVKVACEKEAAIWWCNEEDSTNESTIHMTCANLARGVNEIVDRCRQCDNFNSDKCTLSGQFYTWIWENGGIGHSVNIEGKNKCP